MRRLHGLACVHPETLAFEEKDRGQQWEPTDFPELSINAVPDS